MDDYLDRISAIQLALPSNSEGSKYPLEAGAGYPFWLNVSLPWRIALNTDHRTSRITFVVQMLLIRSPMANMFQKDYEQQIIKDMADIVWGFMSDPNYKNLIVDSFTAMQPGFISGSARIQNPTRFSGQVGTLGDYLGSSYILEWQHYMHRDKGT